jgi:hydroxymethylglutaryl-CoA reductase
MTGQIQLILAEDQDLNAVQTILEDAKSQLLVYANQGQERLVSRGGGAQDITWNHIPEIRSLVLHLHVDTRDAMGANIVNTMCEKVSAPRTARGICHPRV